MTVRVDEPNLAGPSSRDARFAVWWTEHHPAVMAYARRRAPAPAAADAVSAAFVTLWRHVDDPPADPLPWLMAVTRRELANLRRGENRRRALLARLSSAGRASSGARDTADAALDGTRARTALRRLRPGDREVLMLIAWEGLDPDRAAAVLGVSPKTLAVRLHRARRRLESHLSAASQEERS